VRRSVAVLFLVLTACVAHVPWPIWQTLTLPLRSDSVRFAVIGDSGTGGRLQYEVASRMADFHERFPFTFVIMLGDNMYGGEQPEDFERKFSRPYRALLAQSVDFYAALGNHDLPAERFFAPFHMSGRRYYTFMKGTAQFFALDSNYMDPQQLEWLARELEASQAPWKICFFHHPIYSSGRRHGSEMDLRALVEPLFVRYGVNVVFAGHEHMYERMKPQHGVHYFTSGSSAKLSRDLGKGRPTETELRAIGFDQDREFMLIEIAGDTLFFQAISRTGHTIDAGTITRAPPHVGAAATSRAAPSASPRAADGSRAQRLVGVRGFLLREVGERPIRLEHRCDPPCDLRVADDDADLASGVELDLAHALAADERAHAVADDRAHVQPSSGKLLHLEVAAALAHAPEDAHVDAGFRALLEEIDHRAVGDLRIVDQELPACLADERTQALA